MNPLHKAERSKIKTIRQGGIDQRENTRARSKKAKPYTVYYKFIWPDGPGWRPPWADSWHVKGHYRTQGVAETVIGNMNRKYLGRYKFRWEKTDD